MSENKKNNRLIDDAQAFLAELSTDEESNLTGGGGYGRGYGDDDDDDDGGRRKKYYEKYKKYFPKHYGYGGYDDDEGD
ncbi:MAG: hypothetical protein AAF630_04975 [Cyanobacteria bacterium P01_C01_bin.38]